MFHMDCLEVSQNEVCQAVTTENGPCDSCDSKLWWIQRIQRIGIWFGEWNHCFWTSTMGCPTEEMRSMLMNFDLGSFGNKTERYERCISDPMWKRNNLSKRLPSKRKHEWKQTSVGSSMTWWSGLAGLRNPSGDERPVPTQHETQSGGQSKNSLQIITNHYNMTLDMISARRVALCVASLLSSFSSRRHLGPPLHCRAPGPVGFVEGARRINGRALREEERAEVVRGIDQRLGDVACVAWNASCPTYSCVYKYSCSRATNWISPSSCPKQEREKKKRCAESLLSHCCPQQLQKLTAQQTQHQRPTTTTCIIPKRLPSYFQCWARRVVTPCHPCLAGGIQQLSIVQYRCRYSTVLCIVQCSVVQYAMWKNRCRYSTHPVFNPVFPAGWTGSWPSWRAE